MSQDNFKELSPAQKAISLAEEAGAENLGVTDNLYRVVASLAAIGISGIELEMATAVAQNRLTEIRSRRMCRY